MDRQTGRVPVIELRQYTLRPGRRDELVALFEDHFTKAQEQCGIDLIGTFRDLADPDRFVWVRGFPDMTRREQALRGFYGGPVWRRHREAANSTMVDSDNVLLLRPGSSDWMFDQTRAASAGEAAGSGRVQAGIVGLTEPVNEGHIAYFSHRVAPLIETEGGRILACLVTEPALNNFPSLPVREGENVLVWFAGFSEPLGARPNGGTSLELTRVMSGWPGVAQSAEMLALAPTRDSRLTGNSVAANGRNPLDGPA